MLVSVEFSYFHLTIVYITFSKDMLNNPTPDSQVNHNQPLYSNPQLEPAGASSSKQTHAQYPVNDSIEDRAKIIGVHFNNQSSSNAPPQDFLSLEVNHPIPQDQRIVGFSEENSQEAWATRMELLQQSVPESNPSVYGGYELPRTIRVGGPRPPSAGETPGSAQSQADGGELVLHGVVAMG